MGRGNICPDGKYEGVVYVDYDNVLCYTKKDDSEQRLLKDISYEEMPEFEFDDDASQLLLDEYRTNLVNEMMRRYQSFEEPNQTWLPNHRNGKVILENKLFYICDKEDSDNDTQQYILKNLNSLGNSVDFWGRKNDRQHVIDNMSTTQKSQLLCYILRNHEAFGKMTCRDWKNWLLDDAEPQFGI